MKFDGICVELIEILVKVYEIHRFIISFQSISRTTMNYVLVSMNFMKLLSEYQEIVGVERVNIVIR